MLVQTKLRPDHHQTARIVDAYFEKQSELLKKSVLGLRRVGKKVDKLLVAEIDCWPSPFDHNYFGVLLHGLTENFEPRSFLLYTDILGTPETAQNQGQRLLSVCRDMLGDDITEVCWAIQSDNTPKASNVPAVLNLRSLRCFAHILALGPTHLLHPVRRQRDRAPVWVMHENAVPEVYDFCERLRAFIKHLDRHEELRKSLTVILRRHNSRIFKLPLDSSSKWNSTFFMLDTFTRMQASIMDWLSVYGDKLPRGAGVALDDFRLARQLAGVLRPVFCCSQLMQGNAFKGSSVLPLLHTLETWP